MLNRERDVLYCGVDRNKIAVAKPTFNQDVVSALYEFIVDRYNIHIKKDVEKVPKPWTDNPILKIVKFTNVRREHDRESLNLINNITSKTDVSLKDRFFNIIVMRFWNKYESFKLATGGELLKFPLSDNDFNKCIERIESYPEHTWWSGAYYTAPVRSWLERIHFNKVVQDPPINYATSPLYFAKYVLTDDLWDNIEKCNDPSELFALLTSIPWMGNFLVYQWFIDLTYCEDYWFSENEYVVSGPGCTKGVNLLFSDKDGMNEEECLFWLRDNQMELFKDFSYDPKTLFSDLVEHDRKLSLMSFENLINC